MKAAIPQQSELSKGSSVVKKYIQIENPLSTKLFTKKKYIMIKQCNSFSYTNKHTSGAQVNNLLEHLQIFKIELETHP